MNTHDKKDGMTLTLVEAVETLSSIADLQFEREVGISQQHDITLNDKELTYHTVHWLHEKGATDTINIVKETFRVILNYLQNFYTNDYSHITDTKAIEGIKTIMVLVGEAAKKLDKYTTLFNKTNEQSITNLKEYKQLQEFYLNRVAKKIDEGTISKWILALARKGADREKKLGPFKSQNTKHVFIDLESVKKDTEYELFFLRKEDGTRFFSPRLIRNIKLISDFGLYLGDVKEEDPLLNIGEWQDKTALACAKNIMRSTKIYIEKFFKVARLAKEGELVENVNKMLMALMLAGNPRHIRQEMKHNRFYFKDFQLYLRTCLQSAEYQKFMAYPPDKSNQFANVVISLLRFISMALYTQLTGYQEWMCNIHRLIDKSTEKLSADHKEVCRSIKKLWSKLAGDYAAMSKLLKNHTSGPLNKILNVLEDGECNQFDPLHQENLPSQLYTLYSQENRIQFARWPSPTHQEFINKASVNEEFKSFLNGCAHEHTVNKVLLFNFQDRTSWKEHCRCLALEDLSNRESFSKHINVVTIARDTEFYYQLAPYHQESNAGIFMQLFQEQLSEGNGSYFFPSQIRKDILRNFVPGALEEVHRIFFSQKNVLTREQRLDFIEIFYLFLQLKIIECLKPDYVGFTCKDGLDVASSAAAKLFVFLKLLHQERLSENDQEHLELMLYGPCLISRERIMMADRFNRVISVIKTMELVREHFGLAGFAKIIQKTFGQLYKTQILNGKMIVQSNKDIF
jgi:hypothetical protein